MAALTGTMLESLLQLTILFVVIIDPLLSMMFFVTHTKGMSKSEKVDTAFKAIAFAVAICALFLVFGDGLLRLFSIELDHFRVAGGIILCILGVKMSLGLTFKNNVEDSSEKNVVAAIIATPLISGPACITTILVSSVDYGRLVTGIALGIVLLLTAILLLIGARSNIRKVGEVGIKMTTTILGLVTLGWGVSFIMSGLGV
ncbi:MarC family protein [Candidatus Woesearchaeota archaeon]|nr:MarC family protein [Candidatus Woesearchaeota archaeon]